MSKKKDEVFEGRKPCWLIWVILPSGHTAVAPTMAMAVCLAAEKVAKAR